MACSNLYITCIILSFIILTSLLVTFSKVSSVDNGHTSDYMTRLEGCEVFKCENGREPQQNRTYKPVVGRCGHESEKIEPYVQKFKKVQPCCNERDQCFQTCGKRLIECEESFSKCLKARGVDEANIAQYKTVVQTPKCSTFWNAQKKACSCEAVEPGTSEDEERNTMEVEPSSQQPKEESSWATHKPKLKIVERGTADNKQLYIMPEHEDEEEYIKNNPLPGYHEEL